MKKIKEFSRKYRTTIVITFEIFWIIVFVLSTITSQAGQEIPQFVYMNF